MTFKPRHLDDLAEEVGGVSKAKALLKTADAVLVGSWYDHGALEAMFAEPKRSNIDKKEKCFSTIAETDGIGAIKKLLDVVSLDITRHVYRGSNSMVLRNASGKRRHVKVLTASRYTIGAKRAQFSVGNVFGDSGSQYYLFVCFDGPVAWVLRKSAVQQILQKMRDEGLTSMDSSFYLPKCKENEPGGTGRLLCRLNPDSPHVLSWKAQLGL